MEVQEKQNMYIIKANSADFKSFRANLGEEFGNFDSQNLVIDLTKYSNLSKIDVELLLPFAMKQKKHKKSFVVVAVGVDFNEIVDNLPVVRTIQEAQDIIDLEEIERDLGF